MAKTLEMLNSAGQPEAAAMIEPLIERSPQIARVVASQRPFQDPSDVAHAIQVAVLGLDDAARIELFRAHPELAPDHPLAMTAESQAEQGRLNLTSATSDIGQRIRQLNRAYRNKFGFPFITAVVRHETIDSILRELEQRLTAEKSVEMDTALGQIVLITRARVANVFGKSQTLEVSRDG